MLSYLSLTQEIQVSCAIFSKLCPEYPRKKRNTQSWEQIIQMTLPLSTTWVYLTLQPVPSQSGHRAPAQSGQGTCPGFPAICWAVTGALEYSLLFQITISSSGLCLQTLPSVPVVPKTSCITSAFPPLGPMLPHLKTGERRVALDEGEAFRFHLALIFKVPRQNCWGYLLVFC